MLGWSRVPIPWSWISDQGWIQATHTMSGGYRKVCYKQQPHLVSHLMLPHAKVFCSHKCSRMVYGQVSQKSWFTTARFTMYEVIQRHFIDCVWICRTNQVGLAVKLWQVRAHALHFVKAYNHQLQDTGRIHALEYVCMRFASPQLIDDACKEDRGQSLSSCRGSKYLSTVIQSPSLTIPVIKRRHWPGSHHDTTP